jgi:hypothetical protein
MGQNQTPSRRTGEKLYNSKASTGASEIRTEGHDSIKDFLKYYQYCLFKKSPSFRFRSKSGFAYLPSELSELRMLSPELLP